MGSTGQQRLIPLLRGTAAAVSLIALLLCCVNLISFIPPLAGGWIPTTEMALVDRVSRALIMLAWGVGFAALGLVTVWRVGDRFAVLIAALFLGVYALWSGVGGSPFFVGAPWVVPTLWAIDALAHSIGIRFTQLFPRPLTAEDVLLVGPGPFRRFVSPVLAGLTRPRFFWPFAIALEGTMRWAGSPGAFFWHVVLWLMLGTIYLYIAYRTGSRADRRRIFWIMEGVAVFLLMEVVWTGLWSLNALEVLSVDLAFWSRLNTTIGAWATLVCFALAIFYSGALDSGMILRRTTVASVAGVVALILFIALETTVGEVLEDMAGLNSRVGDILIGVIAALAFHPISRRINGWMVALGARQRQAPPNG